VHFEAITSFFNTVFTSIISRSALLSLALLAGGVSDLGMDQVLLAATVSAAGAVVVAGAAEEEKDRAEFTVSGTSVQGWGSSLGLQLIS